MTSNQNLTVEKLMNLKKEFDQLFPARDLTQDMSMLSQFFWAYGFCIVPRDLPVNTIAVSPDVYAFLCGTKSPQEVLK